MYGYRARIGYTSPPMLTEVFPYEFYKIVPEGVTLVLTTLAINEYTREELEQSLELSLRAAREMARARVNLIVLGGVPINLARGFEKVDELIRTTEEECGVPVTTSVTAQLHALAQVEARKVVVINPRAGANSAMYADYLGRSGFEMVGLKDAGSSVRELSKIPADIPFQLAREAVRDYPDADTVYFPAPHWAVSGVLDRIERELGVKAVGALQAIVWESLRRCGVLDSIPGYGRLLREF